MNTSQFSPGAAGLLEPLAPYFSDPDISEIMINQAQEIWIEKNGIMSSIHLPLLSELHLHRLFQLIANENHQKLSKEYPLLSGNLPDGSRVQLCIPPSSKHYVLAIRRKLVRDFSLENYERNNFYQETYPSYLLNNDSHNLSNKDQNLLNLYHHKQWGLFVYQAILAKKNIVISGGTSSGKTTYLNACLKAIPEDQRIIILEDTREIEASHLNQINLLSSVNISMQSLIQASLRLRPDRIIMGEIRGKEMMDFVSACATGHEGSMTTIHANNPEIAFLRMTQMYKLNSVPSMTDQDILRELRSVIDIIIQINKTPSGRLAQGIYYRYAAGTAATVASENIDSEADFLALG